MSFSPARHLAQEQLLGDAAAHQDRDLRFQKLACGVPVGLSQLHRHAERPAARDDRHLVRGSAHGSSAATTA